MDSLSYKTCGVAFFFNNGPDGMMCLTCTVAAIFCFERLKLLFERGPDGMTCLTGMVVGKFCFEVKAILFDNRPEGMTCLGVADVFFGKAIRMVCFEEMVVSCENDIEDSSFCSLRNTRM